MLGGNEFRLREVGGFAANFNRANRRGDGFAVFDARSARSVFSDVHAVGKNEFNSISPPAAAKLCEADKVGARRFEKKASPAGIFPGGA